MLATCTVPWGKPCTWFQCDLRVVPLILFGTWEFMRHEWHSWLRHCTTSWKVAGSIPNDVTGIFHWHNPSGRTVALGLTQPVTEMSTRNISWGVKAAGAYGWQPYRLHVPNVMKSWSLNLLEPSGPVQACNGIALPLHESSIYPMCQVAMTTNIFHSNSI